MADQNTQASRPSSTCIICGDPAGSGEHLFPAALGGRRTHNGIYCKRHNERFSPFVAVIAEQLAPLNGFLDVRHDRDKKKPLSPIIQSSDGSHHSVVGAKFIPQSAITVSRTQVNDREHVMLAVPENLMGTYKAMNVIGEIDILSKGRLGPRLQDQDFSFSLALGGPKFLLAISYVCMTYFAKYHPELSREKTVALESLKACLNDSAQKSEENLTSFNHAWWESTETLDSLPNTPFRFSHTIAISTSQETNHATAYICLFGVFCFGIDFGGFAALSDHKVVVHLDPLSLCFPNDQVEHIQPGSALCIAPPKQNKTEHLQNSLSNGEAERRLNTFIAKSIDWHLERAAIGLIERVSLTPCPVGAVHQLLDGEEQRIFNMMKEFVQYFRDNCVPTMPADLGSVYAEALQLQINPQTSSPDGLTQVATASLFVAKVDLAKKILTEYELGELTLEKAKMLIGGKEGQAVVGRSMLTPIFGHDFRDE